MGSPLQVQHPFVSLNRVGTGAEESISHGLGVGNPDYLWILPQQNCTFSRGTQTPGKLVFTVELNKSYDLVAGWLKR